MKKTYLLALTLMLLGFTSSSFAQNEKGDQFWKMLKAYYYAPDKAIVSKTIDYLNAGIYDADVFEFRLKAFYSALFGINPTVKAEYEKKKAKIKSAELSDLMETISGLNIEDVYANAPQTPDVNEMLCYSYFATGETKYIDLLLDKAKDNEERADLDKYMVGANALWWLATLRDDNILVQEYLQTKPANKYAETALKSRAYDLKNIQLEVLTAQKKKGVWK